MLQYTPIDDIEKIRDELKAGFASGKLRSIAYRKYQLKQLMYVMKDNFERWDEALSSDMGRPLLEGRFLELVPTVTEILTQYKNVEKWAKPEKPAFDLSWTPLRPVTIKEPKGTVLIITPFNYPVWLTICPLAGAIAAGCTVLIKPSEQSSATSSLMAELLHNYLDTDLVRVVNGSIAETTKLLELQWDHIAYTGSARVGKVVLAAASKHLTPVTLELGGKSPVIIDPGCDLKITTRRLLWGKLANAGQTCVAPDYVLVPRDFQDKFVEALKEVYTEFYPDGSDPSKPGTFSRIITSQASSRIAGLLDKSQGKVVFGGVIDKENKYISPTVVRDVSMEDSLMTEEIFGPILPILPVDNIDEAITSIQQHPNPLVVYLFTRDEKLKAKISSQVRTGALVVNETVIHPGARGLPFGGIGQSGFGYQTGIYTFNTFTHLKASIESPSWIDRILFFRFPPYTDRKVSLAMNLLQSLPPRPKGPPPIKGVGVRRWWDKIFAVVLAIALAKLVIRRRS